MGSASSGLYCFGPISDTAFSRRRNHSWHVYMQQVFEWEKPSSTSNYKIMKTGEFICVFAQLNQHSDKTAS